MPPTEMLKPSKGEILDFTNEETHWHRCPACKRVWAHMEKAYPSVAARIDDHRCPHCRTWTGEQIDVSIFESRLFLENTSARIIGPVRLTSPKGGF